MNDSVKPSRGPRSTFSFSGSDGERRENPLVLTTIGRRSPATRITVSPYSRADSIAPVSGTTLQSFTCRTPCATASADSPADGARTSGRMTDSLMAALLTMPSKKKTAQQSPDGLRTRRVTKVLSPEKTACKALIFSDRSSVNWTDKEKPPFGG